MPAEPQPIRLFEQIGFGMTLFLSASEDYAEAGGDPGSRVTTSEAKLTGLGGTAGAQRGERT
jgi:hypothetical protein